MNPAHVHTHARKGNVNVLLQVDRSICLLIKRLGRLYRSI